MIDTNGGAYRAAPILLAMLLVACSQGKSTQQPAASAPAPAASTASAAALTMDRHEGTPVSTTLGYGIVLNKESSLKREWFVVADPVAPVAIEGAAGVNVVYQAGERYSSGDYQYKASYKVVFKEPVTAVEIRAQLFDVFGGHVRTLSATSVSDLEGSTHLTGTWRVLSENEAASIYSSVIYVAQARTAAGKVYTIDSAQLLEQLKKVAAKITEADITPKKAEK